MAFRKCPRQDLALNVADLLGNVACSTFKMPRAETRQLFETSMKHVLQALLVRLADKITRGQSFGMVCDKLAMQYRGDIDAALFCGSRQVWYPVLRTA